MRSANKEPITVDDTVIYDDGELHVWGKVVLNDSCSVYFSCDGRMYAVRADDKNLRVWRWNK